MGVAFATDIGRVTAKLNPADFNVFISKESTTVTEYEMLEGILVIVLVIADTRTPALSHRYPNGPIPPW